MNYTQILEFARAMRKNPTYAEKVFWENVRRKALKDLKINRQFVIEHAEILNSKSFFIADFYCHSLKTIFEIDGNIILNKLNMI